MLTLTELEEHGITPAVYYFVARELAAGRPVPTLKGRAALSEAQIAWIRAKLALAWAV